MLNLLRDWFGVWAIDRAGVEQGNYRLREVRKLLDSGVIDPHTWMRHRWTRRYALVGEVLYYNSMASEEEFNSWFPSPKQALV